MDGGHSGGVVPVAVAVGTGDGRGGMDASGVLTGIGEGGGTCEVLSGVDSGCSLGVGDGSSLSVSHGSGLGVGGGSHGGDGLGYHGGHGLGVVGGLDLSQGLVVGGLVSNDAHDGLLGKDGLVLEDGAGHMVGLHDGGRLDLGDVGGLVDVGVLGNGEGGLGDFRGHGSVGVGLGGGVGKVAAIPVGLDGGRVVGGGAHQGGGSVSDLGDGGLGGRGGRGGSQESSGNKSLRKEKQIDYYR